MRFVLRPRPSDEHAMCVILVCCSISASPFISHHDLRHACRCNDLTKSVMIQSCNVYLHHKTANIHFLRRYLAVQSSTVRVFCVVFNFHVINSVL